MHGGSLDRRNFIHRSINPAPAFRDWDGSSPAENQGRSEPQAV
eukprot:SAG31_NODE_38965_length_292_cov_0.414508_1_plen_42_part_01